MKLYKWLAKDGSSYNGGVGKWPLPAGNRPGAWMPKLELPLIECKHGYHLCRPCDLPYWISPTLWVAEARGHIKDWDDKVGVQQARLLRRIETWNGRVARLFACDCAERALHCFETHYPGNDRLQRAVEIMRRSLENGMTHEEFTAANANASQGLRIAWLDWHAGGPKATPVAWDAAHAVLSAIWAVGNWGRFPSAVDAVRNAVIDAGRATGWAKEECEWQAMRLCKLLGIELDEGEG